MWEHWKDVWTALLAGIATCLSIYLFMLLLWYSQPTQRVGYHIEETVVNSGKMKYYEVVAINRHGSNRSIYSTTDFNQAQEVLLKLQTIQEAE